MKQLIGITAAAVFVLLVLVAVTAFLYLGATEDPLWAAFAAPFIAFVIACVGKEPDINSRM